MRRDAVWAVMSWTFAAACSPGVADLDPDASPTDPDPTVPSTPAPDPDPDPDPDPTATTDTATVPTAPACVGKAGMPGDTEHALDVGGVTRTFRLHVPDDVDPDAPIPVVFAFHGYTMSGERMQEVTAWDAVADREGVAVLYPDGDLGLIGGPWSVGDGVCGAGAFANGALDDFAFVEAMLSALSSVQCVDEDRVFATGFSMGAYFTNHLACEGPVPLRAIAPHSGGTYGGACVNGPVPALVLHGDADPIIDVDCGADTAAQWLERDVCPAIPAVEVPVAGGSCAVVEGCAGGTSVSHCVFDGMDHGWAGSADVLYGGGTDYEDAAELSWSFFARF